MHVDPMFLCHTTGHDGKGFSNLFEYMDASVAMAIPGAVVLAGGLRYRARLGKAPVPADLFASSRKAIVSGWSCLWMPYLTCIQPRRPCYCKMVTSGLPSARAPPALSCTIRSESARGGTLRPCQAIETVEGMKLYDPGASADTTLIRWSAELRAKFTSDNQHLLLPR
ncbi:hypothetical protein RI054_03g18050 [Pseudoscourfieldia marina]